VCFNVQSFEGGSPHLSRLRTDRLAQVSNFDYVMAHTGFMESRKLSSFVGHRDRSYPTVPLRCHFDSVWATHGCPLRYHMKDVH
jgi:hypothetical protein